MRKEQHIQQLQVSAACTYRAVWLLSKLSLLKTLSFRGTGNQCPAQLGVGFRHSPPGLIVQGQLAAAHNQLAAAHNQQGQNAAHAQEVTRLQRQVAALQAVIANQADIIRQNQQSRRELTQQHAAAQAGTSSHASSHYKALQHELLNHAYLSAAGVTCMASHAIMFMQSGSAWQEKLHLWQQESVL